MLVLLAERADTRNYTGERLLPAKGSNSTSRGLLADFDLNPDPSCPSP